MSLILCYKVSKKLARCIRLIFVQAQLLNNSSSFEYFCINIASFATTNPNHIWKTENPIDASGFSLDSSSAIIDKLLINYFCSVELKF